MRYFYFFLFFTIVSFSSCKFVDPDELVPSYIYIEDITLSTTSTEGSNSDNIIDAWVYVNGSNIGVFELPSKIPIHVHGNYTLQVFAGIKKSGLSALRVQNEFMVSFDTTVNSIPNRTDTIIPSVSYEAGATFWVEDFEDPGVKFTTLSYSDTSIFITNDPSEVLEGNGSGKIQFESSYRLFEAKTNELSFNNFPRGGKPVYVELEYKSNEILTVGIYHNNTSTSSAKEEYFNLFPTGDKWKKIYLDLKDVVSPQLKATEFDLYLEVEKIRSSLPLVYIDNIKVIF